jgi:hypothetical protein
VIEEPKKVTDAEKALAAGEEIWLEYYGYVGRALVDAPPPILSLSDCVDGAMILSAEIRGDRVYARWMLLRGHSPHWQPVGEVTITRRYRTEEAWRLCASR